LLPSQYPGARRFSARRRAEAFTGATTHPPADATIRSVPRTHPITPLPAVGREAATAVRAERVTKIHGTAQAAVRALDEVSLEVPRGRFVAIMGPSGSGKSTLMHCLAGLDTVTSGRVLLGGVELGRLTDTELTRLRRERVGFVFQAFNLLPALSARENITLPLDLAGERPDRGWMEQIVDALGLADRLSHRPSELSGGQQQRVAVARAMISKPQLVFADEPTGSLDSGTGRELLGFLAQAVHQLGQTIVMVTHDPVAATFADEALFLADGRIVDRISEPTPQQVLDHLGRLPCSR
jgi:putative ABC transport system ATP-binding protein